MYNKIKFKQYIFIISMIIVLSLFLETGSKASHWGVEGWDWIEGKDEVTLWQKKGEDFISEAVINNTAALGSVILRGYTLKKTDSKSIIAFQYQSYPIGIWKLVYNGFDSSGNINLKLYREKDDLKKDEIKDIENKISTLSSSKENEKRLIEMRLEEFSSSFEKHLQKEGEMMTVDPAKIIVIIGLNDSPPFKITINNKHSIINLEVESLDK